MAERKHTIRKLQGGRSGAKNPAAGEMQAVRRMAALVGDFASTLELEQVLRNTAEGLRDLVDYDTFAVLLLDDLGRQLAFDFAVGFPDDVVANWRFGMGQGIVGTAAQTGETISVDDVRTDPRYISATEIRSELAIPLLAKGRTIGVLDVGSRQPNHFTDENRQLLAFLAGHLANGIENARLYKNVKAQARTLSLMHEVSRELTSILDRERLLGKVAELVGRIIDYHVFTVMVWNEQTQLLEHTFLLRHDERFVQKGGFSLGQGVTGTVAALRQPMRVPNVHLNAHYTDCGHGVEVRSELAVPLVFKDRLIGVLDLESTEYNAFTEQHEQMLSTLGSYIAVGLENARLYQRVTDSERRMEHDLRTAREIQKQLLPDELPEVAGAEVGFAYLPANQLGGDFFDFLHYGENRLAFAVGDVAGKGTPAALYGALGVGILRGHVVEHPCEPAEMLAHMNEHLAQARVDNRYAATAFGIFDASDKSLVIGNAGFPRPVLVRDGRVEEIRVEGVPLGMFSGMRYEEKRLQLQPDDLIVLTSDGINESTDRRCEEFGTKRLQSELVGLAGLPAQQVADALVRSSERHAVGNSTGADDRTVVVLKVL